MTGKRGGKRGAGKRKTWRPKKGRAPRRSKYEVSERASLTEVSVPNMSGQGTPTANVNFMSYNISLNVSTRARDVARGYQFYRIKRITYVIKPLVDTFTAAGALGGPSIPYLYYMIDRVKQFQNGFTIDQLKAMGAKPRRLDEKTLTFSYTPSVLTETYDNTPGANAAVQYKLSPWLPCKDTSQVGVWNPNTTDHQGVVWRVQQDVGTAQQYVIERRIQFEFKKPAVPTMTGVPEVVPIEADADVLV